MVGGDGPALVYAANQTVKVDIGTGEHQQYIARFYLWVEELKFYHRHHTIALSHGFESEVFGSNYQRFGIGVVIRVF